ncbi:glycosyltransferase family 1 protein, partial [Vibrio sp. 10N.286.51.A4]
DIVKGWKKTTNCFVYGPGYPGYNNDDDIDSVIEKSPFKKEDLDIIVFSTSWDDDESDDNVDPHCNIRLEKIDSVKKIYYLNKEYKKLELRFDYAKLQSVDLIVTVHPNFKLWEEEVGIRFVQSHFAVDLARFGYNNEPKDYDFGFTGGLHMKHLDFRSKVKNEIFLD